jgi:hypothetical protein
MSKSKALRELSYRDASAKDHERFYEEAHSDANDRGACILLSADVENGLDNALTQIVLPHFDRGALFGEQGPLSTFSRKITMAHALRITGPITHQNLGIIRQVRNAFAHSKIPIDFDTPEVAAICADLRMVDPTEKGVDTTKEHEGLFPRSVFRLVCNHTSFLLYKYSLGPLIQFPTSDLKPEHGSWPTYDLYIQRQSLP